MLLAFLTALLSSLAGRVTQLGAELVPTSEAPNAPKAPRLAPALMALVHARLHQIGALLAAI
ncbi:MAG: hypothetical protein ACP5NP_13325, partial [Acetobacteraceae bacterium]